MIPWLISAALYGIGAYTFYPQVQNMRGPQPMGWGYAGAVKEYDEFARRFGRKGLLRIDRFVTRTMVAAWPLVMLLAICIDIYDHKKGRSHGK